MKATLLLLLISINTYSFNTFSNGQTISASQMNQNFNRVQRYIFIGVQTIQQTISESGSNGFTNPVDIELDTVVLDTYNGFDNANDSYTIPYDGYYEVHSMCTTTCDDDCTLGSPSFSPARNYGVIGYRLYSGDVVTMPISVHDMNSNGSVTGNVDLSKECGYAVKMIHKI